MRDKITLQGNLVRLLPLSGIDQVMHEASQIIDKRLQSRIVKLLFRFPTRAPEEQYTNLFSSEWTVYKSGDFLRSSEKGDR